MYSDKYTLNVYPRFIQFVHYLDLSADGGVKFEEYVNACQKLFFRPPRILEGDVSFIADVIVLYIENDEIESWNVNDLPLLKTDATKVLIEELLTYKSRCSHFERNREPIFIQLYNGSFFILEPTFGRSNQLEKLERIEYTRGLIEKPHKFILPALSDNYTSIARATLLKRTNIV